jgi:hypothetical protein
MMARHAAALALAALVSISACERRAFWLLMLPPLDEKSQVHSEVPLYRWTPAGPPLASIEQCEQNKKAMMAFGNSGNAQQIYGKFKSFSQAQREGVSAMMSQAICASSNDPRLVPK